MAFEGKYGVLGSILHEVNLLEFFPFRSPGAYIWRRKANWKMMAFSEYKRRVYVWKTLVWVVFEVIRQ